MTVRNTGPLYTLIMGVVAALALALFGRAEAVEPPNADTDPKSPSTTAPAASPSARPSDAAPVTYAARAEGSRAVVALTVRGDRAIAYVCDGRRLEEWLRGKLYAEGVVKLEGEAGIVTASLDGGRMVGAAKLGDHPPLAFEAGRVAKPSGLYRATATVRGARFTGGWIVLPGGDQVGLAEMDGEPREAPPFDPSAGAVRVDGQQVPVAPADPARP